MSSRYRIRGASTDWFRRFLVRTFGGENVADAPSSRYASRGLDVENTIQPVLVVNSETGLELPDVVQVGGLIIPTPSDPTKLYNGMPVTNTEDDAGAIQPLQVSTSGGTAGGRKFISLNISGSFAAFNLAANANQQGQLLADFPDLTAYREYGFLRDCTTLIFRDVGLEHPVTDKEYYASEFVNLTTSTLLEVQYSGNQFSQIFLDILGLAEAAEYNTTGTQLATGQPAFFDEALTTAIPIPLQQLDTNYNAPRFRVAATWQNGSPNTPQAIPQTYVNLKAIIEVWDATGGNSADYPFVAGQELTFLTAAFTEQ